MISSLLLTKFEARVLYAALILYREENEIAIHHTDISTDEQTNNDLLSIIGFTQAAEDIQAQITAQFGITEKQL